MRPHGAGPHAVMRDQRGPAIPGFKPGSLLYYFSFGRAAPVDNRDDARK